MYLLDPDEGAKRRGYLSDQAQDALESGSESVQSLWSSAGDSARSARDRISEGYDTVRDTDLVARLRQLRHPYSEPETHWTAALSIAGAAVGVAALGAGLWFLLDPKHGEERRSALSSRAEKLMDKAKSTWGASEQADEEESSSSKPEQSFHPGATGRSPSPTEL